MKRLKRILINLSVQAIIVSNPNIAACGMVILAIVVIGIQYAVDWQPILLPHVMAISCIGVAIPYFAAYLNRQALLLDNIVNEITEGSDERKKGFLEDHRRRVFNDPIAFTLPIIFALVGLQTIVNLGIPWYGVAATAYNSLVFFVLTFVGGIGWLFFTLTLLLQRVSNLEISGEPFHWPIKHFKQLNRIYMKVFASGVFLYLGALLGVWLIPWGNFLLLNTSFSYLWVLPLAGVVTLYFVLCQYYIHLIMTHSKERRIEQIDKLLDSTFKAWIKMPSDDKASILSELINWRKLVGSEPDWPFNFQSSLAIIGSIFLPAIGTFVDIMLKRF